MNIDAIVVVFGLKMISWIANAILWFVGLFLNHINLLDAVLTVLAVWSIMYYKVGWNGWLALLLGLLAALIVYIVFKHRIGFWIVSTMYSFAWGFLIVGIVRSFWFPSSQELHAWIWVAVVTALGGWSHYSTRDYEWANKLITEEQLSRQFE